MQVSTTHTRVLLSCGALAALLYMGTDISASLLYPGYSYQSQAVSELFAIGAPTRLWTATLLSISSILVFAFSLGIWGFAGSRRLLRALALAFAGSAVIGLLIWTAFPMHMRGVERSFTDTMHLALASNPFVLLSLGLAISAIPGRFRLYSLGTAAAMLTFAIPAFSYAKAVDLNLPTPWLGATERLSQYIYALWQLALAIVLRRQVQSSKDQETAT